MVTAEGAFVLLDRASRPLKDMERQANRTMRAFEKLGVTVDAVGGDKTIRNYEKMNRQLRSLDRTEAGVVRQTDRMTRSFTRNRRETDGLWASVRKLGATLMALTRIISLLKFPALAAGIGLAVQAVGALVGGVIALTPRLADLAGVMTGLPATIGAVVGGMVTAKFAFKDFSQAMGGNTKAMERMTPAARRLIDTLKLYSPVMQQLRAGAQEGGLFSGVDFAVRRLQRAVPMADRLLRMFSARLGGLAREGATRFTSQGFLRDFEALGGQSGRILTLMGRGLFNLVEALMDVSIAARPFTRWMSDVIYGWTEWAKNAAQAGRDTGRFQQSLIRTRASLTGFGHIIRDVWFTLRNLGRAARPLGDDLWESSERATAGWRRYTASIQGQIRFARDFGGMRDTIHELVGLVGDLGAAIWRMGSAPGTANMVARLRDAVPHLERILTVITEAFGPPVIEALGALGRTIENLVGASGPLTIFLTLITGVLNVVNDLLDKFPALGRVVTGAIAVVGINLMIRRVQSLAGAWMAVAGGASAAAAAQNAATGGSLLGGMFGGRAGRRASRAAGAGYWGVLDDAWGSMRPGRGARAAGALGRYGRLALRGAGKFVLPAAAVMGAFDGLTARREGNFGAQAGQTASAILSGASLGLIPRWRTGSEKMEANERLLLEGGTRHGGLHFSASRGIPAVTRGPSQRVMSLPDQLASRLSRFGGERPSNRSDVVGQIRVYEQHIARVSRLQSAGAQQYRAELEAQVEALRQVNAQLRQMEENNRRARRARAVRSQQNLAGRIASGLGTRFNAQASQNGVEAAMLDTAGVTVKAMKDLEGPGRRALAQNVLAWAREAAQQNPKLKNEYEKLQDDIERGFKQMGDNVIVENGRIFQNSKRDWASIRRTLVQEAQLAKLGVGNNFAAIRAMAVTQLTAMGFTPQQAGAIAQRAATGKGTANLESYYKTGGINDEGQSARVGAAGKRDGPARYMGTGSGTGGRSGGGGSSNTGGLIAVGRMLQSMGFQVGEHPAFGGVAPVHTANSYHYRGQAIDVNWPGGGPAEMAALDRIYPMLRAMNPTELIWRAKGHYDHLHLAMGGGPGGTYIPGMGGGMGTATGVSLRAPAMTVGGLGGALGQQATNMYAAGLSKRMNEQLMWGGWHGRGGTGRFRRPTLIGVGDRDETVTITPRGRGGGRPIAITVPIANIDYRGEGDIKRVVEREVRAAVQSIADEIDAMPMEDDRA